MSLKTKVTIFKTKYNNICGFEVKNHTDPIVCGAVSVLSETTVNAVEALTEIGKGYELKIDEESGYLYFMIPSLAEGAKNEKADLLLRAFELSINSVAEAYSDYIKVITVKTKEVSTDDKN